MRVWCVEEKTSGGLAIASGEVEVLSVDEGVVGRGRERWWWWRMV